MRRYTEISNAYRGKEMSFYLIEGKCDKSLNRYIRGNRKNIEEHLRKRGVLCSGINIVSTALFGQFSIKNLLLRQCPTLSKEKLENCIRTTRKEQINRHSRLLYIIGTTENENGDCVADILCEENFSQENGYIDTLYRFLDTAIHCAIERDNNPTTNGIKFRFDEQESFTDSYDYLPHDLLASSIYNNCENSVSPIHFDSKFNIILPLYPQIAIKLAPLPKALFILFLLHPEGILLKHIQDYEQELFNIYCAVSGRRNPSVVKRVFKAITDPSGNPLQKNISIIRKSFTSKLCYDIARNYIPAHNRCNAHSIPIESSMVFIPHIA